MKHAIIAVVVAVVFGLLSKLLLSPAAAIALGLLSGIIVFVILSVIGNGGIAGADGSRRSEALQTARENLQRIMAAASRLHDENLVYSIGELQLEAASMIDQVESKPGSFSEIGFGLTLLDSVAEIVEHCVAVRSHAAFPETLTASREAVAEVLGDLREHSHKIQEQHVQAARVKAQTVKRIVEEL